MWKQEIETQNEILEWLRRIEEQSDPPSVLLGNHGSAESGEAAAASHLPVRELRVTSVEQVYKPRFQRRRGRLWNQVIPEPARERNAGEHRIRRADRRKERRPGDVRVGDLVKAAVGVGHRRILIIAHPQGTRFVMGRAEAVAAA